MSSSLNVHVALSHPYVPATTFSEESLYALLDLEPSAGQGETTRAPINLVIVVDSSGTMHNFQLSDDEREYWMSLAISRDEIERGQADEREAIYWIGQTLAEMQSVAQKPMVAVVEGIKNLLTTLHSGDRVSVIAFADRVHQVFSAADWVTVSDSCIAQLDNLREQRLPVDIGTGTHMAEALRIAGESLTQMQSAIPQAVNRLLVISDGIVQDAPATLASIDTLQAQGFAITTVGVGEEFDEEFLTRVADNSRGEYHYAADAAEITQILQREMTALQNVGLTDLYIAVRGLEGAVVQDMFLVRPSMTLFDEIETKDGWMRARIGDLSSAVPTSVLVQIAPPTLPAGSHEIAETQLTWTAMNSDTGRAQEQAAIKVDFSDDPARLAQANPSVMDIVDRFSIYKYEREAQRAHERGDIETAKEKLGAATRELHKIGEDTLAQDVEQQIAALDGAAADPTRVKRIKATTRRLGVLPPESPRNG